EMIVSLGLFTVILFISMQALLSMVDANHKAQSLRAAMDNLNLSLEEMARNITQGNTYHCGAGGSIEDELLCATGENYLALESYTGDPLDSTDQFVYKLEAETLKKSVNSGANFKNVTAPSIKIEHLKFYVSDNDASGSDEPPRVIISIQGTAGTQQGVISSFNIQTTAVQRTPE
ncbi:hypothetical protein KKH46_03190, partial [Patescibacteria group bacterium]|nr:hypothetical protein [Patescibacteria group bacterium]MBU1956124.1 hypothetical protein [Patescibacteria group bacterium]